MSTAVAANTANTVDAPLTLHPLVATVEMAPIRLEADRGAVTIGRRGGEADIVVDDPTVSRTHARIAFGPDGWTVHNGQPRNGTFLNLIPLPHDEDSPLPSGVIVEFGAIAFAAVLGDEESPMVAFAAPRGSQVATPADVSDLEDLGTVTVDEWRTRIGGMAALDHGDTAVRGRAEESMAKRCLRLADRYVRTACDRTGASRAQAEDATHEATMRLLKAIRNHGGHYYDPAKGSFRALFRTIFVRELLRLSRAEGRVRLDGQAGLTEPYEDRTLMRLMMEDEARQVLATLRERSDPAHWQAFEMFVVRGMAGREVMDALGIRAEGTLYSIIRRMRVKALEIHDLGTFLD